MRRSILVTLTILVTHMSYGQLIVDVDDYVGVNIKEIRKLGYKNRFLRSGWDTEIKFANDTLPRQEINYYKGEIRSDYHYNYERTDSTFQILRIDSIARKDRNFELRKNHFNETGRIYRTEIFTKEDTLTLVIKTDYKRDTSDRIISYNRVIPSSFRNNAGDLVTAYKLFYNDNNQVDSILQIDSEGINRIVHFFEYDRKGKIKRRIVDYNNPDIVITGERGWERGRYDKYGYLYKYDRFGNWKKRYSLTKNRKYLRTRRKIKYE